MAATFGIDAQYSDVCMMLRESAGGRERLAAVGDGRSALIPAAYRDGLWGSAAALAVLREGPAEPGRLLCWRTDPWSAPFLTGLRDRLASYLGATGRHGGEPVVCAGPGTPRDVAQLCAKAGLGRATVAAPTDVLLARWLHGTPQPADGRIVTVACGETWTAVGRYVLERQAGALRIETVAEPSVLPAGCAAWSATLAQQVLERCREGTAAEELLALRDATLECAALLRVQSTVEWTGALAHRLSEPLLVSRVVMTGRPEVVRLIAAVQQTVQGLMWRPDLVVVGGVGAVWPFLGEAMAVFGPVWHSPYPERDLALGAALWPTVREAFAAGQARAGGAVRADQEPGETVPGEERRGHPGRSESAHRESAHGEAGHAGADQAPLRAASPADRDPRNVPPWLR